MSWLRRTAENGRRSRGSSRGAEIEAAARARRARDHLSRKRERERQRLARARSQAALEVRRRRWVRVLSPLVFVAALALGAIAARPVAERLVLETTPLERVAVQGAHVLSAAQVAAATGLVAGMPLAQVDPTALRSTLETDPWIEEALVLRLPTGTLVIDVRERDAIARWSVAEDTGWVDAAGRRFAGAGVPLRDLPRVAGPGREDGAPLADEALLILRELRRHAALSADAARLTLHLPDTAIAEDGVLRASPAGYVLEIGQDGPRALLGRRLLSQRIARLASLLDHEATTLRTARWIDLRYADRAVLGTEPVSG